MGNYGECGNQRHHEVVAGAGQKVHLQKAPAATGYFSPPQKPPSVSVTVLQKASGTCGRMPAEHRTPPSPIDPTTMHFPGWSWQAHG